jgi:site-specific DNA-methyltransferase (adenine-specific)
MIELRHCDCINNEQQGIKSLHAESLDVILIDPPYKYLKNQKLEVDFDEQVFFGQAKRVLKRDGFIVLFGRGTSFYRWCTMLADLGFNFKEEVIWDKGYSTSPVLAISRVHETVAIFSKGKGVINRARVPYLQMKENDLNSVIQDAKRLKGALNNTKSLNAIIAFLENNQVDNPGNIHSENKQIQRADMNTLSANKHKLNAAFNDGDRCCNVVQSFVFGMREKTIIKEARVHYSSIHPTQKPVPLLIRLLKLVTKPGDKVADFFAGSASTGEACIELELDCLLTEMDEEYFIGAKERIEKILAEKEEQEAKRVASLPAANLFTSNLIAV